MLNGAIDMADRDRGNMRCFEAMGCGALLVSDDGNYPQGMSPGETMRAYTSAEHASRCDLGKPGPLAAVGRTRHARKERDFGNLQQVFAMDEFCRSRRADEAVLEHSAKRINLGFDNAH